MVGEHWSMPTVRNLARISHRWSTASPQTSVLAAQTSVLAALRSVGLLDVLHEYDCGGSPRVVSVASLARTAFCGASLRPAMRNAALRGEK